MLNLLSIGLEVPYDVVFYPEGKIDYKCELDVAAESEQVQVPIAAIGLRGTSNYFF